MKTLTFIIATTILIFCAEKTSCLFEPDNKDQKFLQEEENISQTKKDYNSQGWISPEVIKQECIQDAD